MNNLTGHAVDPSSFVDYVDFWELFIPFVILIDYCVDSPLISMF